MRRLMGWCVLPVLLGAFVLALPVSADTLETKDGRVIRGKYLGGTQNQIRFLAEGKVEMYAAETLLALTFGSEPNPLADVPPDPPPPRQEQWKIWSWAGDTAEWSRRFNLTGLRIACDSSPEGCVSFANDEARRENVGKYFLAIGDGKESPATLKDYALQYSRLSAGNPSLYGISLDDFALRILYRWYDILHLDRPTVHSLLDAIFRNAKAVNPNFKFAVTIYENEIGDPARHYLDDAHLPPSIRRKVDCVFLYTLYRMNGPRYEQYVQEAKRLFPAATIIAGSYPYDRTDYVPCSQGNHEDNWIDRNPRARCTLEQEKLYFQGSIETQARLLKEGVVGGIEFFPGYLGNEAKIDWNYYNNSPYGMGCLRSKKTCIANTRAMNQMALATLNFWRAASRIVVSPGAPNVTSGGRQQFTAVAVDPSGKPISPQPAFSWSVSRGGTISSSGVFTAGPDRGGPYTVTASTYGMSGTASVTLVSPAPPRP